MQNNNILTIPELEAEDIEVRAARVGDSWAQLLLYKDARVDMRILDEVFGVFGWQRHHSRENANCIISIKNPVTGEWIDKEDTGTESYTEKEKGLASDSFKRAAFNVGIGRSLYSAPKNIFVNIPTENKNGKWQIDSKKVKDIYVSKYVVIDGKISKLEICINDGQRVYSYDDKRCLPIKNADEAPKTSKNNVPVKEEKPVNTQPVKETPAKPAQKPVEDNSVDYLDLPIELLVKEEEPAQTAQKPDNKPVEEKKTVEEKKEDVDMDEARIVSAEFSTTKNLMKYFKIVYEYRYKPETVEQFQPICNNIGVEAIKKVLRQTKMFEEADIDVISMDNLSNLKGASYALSRAQDVRLSVKVTKNSKGYNEFNVTRI